MRRQATPLIILCAAGSIAGCSGTVVVDYAVEARVRGHDAGGREWHASPSEMHVLPRPPGMLTPFTAIQYRGDRLEWVFGTGTLGLGGKVTNRTPGTLCLLFDQARMASNFAHRSVPFTVYHVSIVLDNDRRERLGSTAPEKRRYFVPPPLCLEANATAHVSYGPDLRDLFPTQKMFNVHWDDKNPPLVDRGIGNWIRLEIPLEYAGKRETLEVTLTATDSAARLSYY